MSEKMETKNNSGVDRGLVAMFLKMSPEERLRANDNVVRAILELKNAYQQQKTTGADLSEIIEGLIKADVNFILVGGLAAVVQGAPVTTMDVDIVYNRSSENISKLFEFVKSIDAIYRRPYQIKARWTSGWGLISRPD
ncbi:MAG: hypothetical protein SRB1_01126 [Desulfobacteraceae bacterium Eth-SRB1]|nr:MAG: hypothetical protein SRB1_01126 [Desulfobacteraceae bacterium Eth-SRB1]